MHLEIYDLITAKAKGNWHRKEAQKYISVEITSTEPLTNTLTLEDLNITKGRHDNVISMGLFLLMMPSNNRGS